MYGLLLFVADFCNEEMHVLGFLEKEHLTEVAVAYGAFYTAGSVVGLDVDL